MTFQVSKDVTFTPATAHLLLRLAETERMGKGLYRGSIKVTELGECSVTCTGDFRSESARDTFCDIWLSNSGPRFRAGVHGRAGIDARLRTDCAFP